MSASHPYCANIWRLYLAIKTQHPEKCAHDIAVKMGISEAELTYARVGYDADRPALRSAQRRTAGATPLARADGCLNPPGASRMKTLLLVLMALSFSLSAAAQKIVSLGGDVTEIIYGLNAQSALVGRDSTSIWPVQAQQLPDVGYLRQLNAEGILSLRPTLVLASAYAQPSRVLQTVQENHVKVVTLPGDYTLAAIDKKIAVVADAIGKPDAGAALRQRLAAQIAALAQQPLNKRALFILSHSGMGTLVAGQQTAADSALRAAGLQNAMQGFDHYRALSQEGVMASQADLIVISADSVKAMGGEENLWHQPGLAQTPAGRKKQLLMVDDIALLGFSVRTPQALLALRQQAEQLP